MTAEEIRRVCASTFGAWTDQLVKAGALPCVLVIANPDTDVGGWLFSPHTCGADCPASACPGYGKQPCPKCYLLDVKVPEMVEAAANGIRRKIREATAR
jgi:hypothetical protein